MEYGVKTDPSGRYACMYKRWHLIGLEVGISVASVGLRREPTGCPTGWRADAVAVAKKNLLAGEILDGEGGYTVVGRLMPAAGSLAQGCCRSAWRTAASCCGRSPRVSRSGGATWRSTQPRAPCARAARWSRLSALRSGTPLEVLVGRVWSASAQATLRVAP